MHIGLHLGHALELVFGCAAVGICVGYGFGVVVVVGTFDLCVQEMGQMSLNLYI